MLLTEILAFAVANGDARPCPHYLHTARNVRVCRSERGTRYLVFDCGAPGCGQRDVVDCAEAGDGLADVNERHGGSRLDGRGVSEVVMPATVRGA